MSRQPRANGPLPRRAVSWAVFVLLATPLVVRADDADAREQVRLMPREERVLLDGKLKQFDALRPDEKASIRAIDDALRALPEEDRSNYYAVLRRYHFWLKSLTDAQRNELNAAPVSQRLALAEKIRKEQRSSSPTTTTALQLADFGGNSPIELATRIKVWLALTPAVQAELAKLQDEPRRTRMSELMKASKFKPIPEPPLSPEQAEAVFDRATKRSPMLDDVVKRAEERKAGRKRVVVDHAYFLEHPPEKVKDENLLRFDSALPPWIRGPFDSLAPDEAKRRLSILYRLVYPYPTEMPLPRPEPKGTAPAASPKASGPSGKNPPARPPEKTGPF